MTPRPAARSLSVLFLTALAGCAAEEAGPLCAGWEQLARGEVAAAVSAEGLDDPSGGGWEATGGIYQVQGAQVLVSVDREDGIQLVAHPKVAIDGRSVPDAVAAGEFPIEVDLGDVDVEGGDAFVYTQAGESFTTVEGAGTGRLVFVGRGDSDTSLAGCFEVEAGDLVDSTRRITLTGGLFHLRELGS